MPQIDMTYEVFYDLLERHVSRYGRPHQVNVQGEGEPTLHRDFFRMAEYAKSKGLAPYTITNGTHKNPDQFIGIFPSIGVSVDTLDTFRADKIGRFNLARVLRFIDVLAPHMQITIHSVRLGPDVQHVAAWAKARGFSHVVQLLQAKEDYRRSYPDLQLPRFQSERFSCAWLRAPLMRSYTYDQQELPCCFIKDLSGYVGIEEMLRHQQTGTWPVSCSGCQHGCA